MDLKEVELVGEEAEWHWYYRSKAKAIRRLLSVRPFKALLDVGSGSGFFARDLLMHTSIREATCVDINYSADTDTKVVNKPLSFRRSAERSQADLVLMIDVLEHIEDDASFLQSWVDKFPQGTHILLSVPAFQFLWSGHDDFLEHKRRYTLAQIEAVAKQSGLIVESSSYYFAAVFPLAAAIRLLQKWVGGKSRKPVSQLKKHHPLSNRLLTAVSGAELPLLKHNRLFGLTVFCLARKP